MIFPNAQSVAESLPQNIYNANIYKPNLMSIYEGYSTFFSEISNEIQNIPLNNKLEETMYDMLDVKFGKIFRMPRFPDETYNYNVYEDLLTPLQWAEIYYKDSLYRQRLKLFIENVTNANKPKAFKEIVEHISGFPCDIEEDENEKLVKIYVGGYISPTLKQKIKHLLYKLKPLNIKIKIIENVSKFSELVTPSNIEASSQSVEIDTPKNIKMRTLLDTIIYDNLKIINFSSYLNNDDKYHPKNILNRNYNDVWYSRKSNVNSGSEYLEVQIGDGTKALPVNKVQLVSRLPNMSISLYYYDDIKGWVYLQKVSGFSTLYVFNFPTILTKKIKLIFTTLAPIKFANTTYYVANVQMLLIGAVFGLDDQNNIQKWLNSGYTFRYLYSAEILKNREFYDPIKRIFIKPNYTPWISSGKAYPEDEEYLIFDFANEYNQQEKRIKYIDYIFFHVLTEGVTLKIYQSDDKQNWSYVTTINNLSSKLYKIPILYKRYVKLVFTNLTEFKTYYPLFFDEYNFILDSYKSPRKYYVGLNYIHFLRSDVKLLNVSPIEKYSYDIFGLEFPLEGLAESNFSNIPILKTDATVFKYSFEDNQKFFNHFTLSISPKMPKPLNPGDVPRYALSSLTNDIYNYYGINYDVINKLYRPKLPIIKPVLIDDPSDNTIIEDGTILMGVVEPNPINDTKALGILTSYCSFNLKTRPIAVEPYKTYMFSCMVANNLASDSARETTTVQFLVHLYDYQFNKIKTIPDNIQTIQRGVPKAISISFQTTIDSCYAVIEAQSVGVYEKDKVYRYLMNPLISPTIIINDTEYIIEYIQDEFGVYHLTHPQYILPDGTHIGNNALITPNDYIYHFFDNFVLADISNLSIVKSNIAVEVDTKLGKTRFLDYYYQNLTWDNKVAGSKVPNPNIIYFGESQTISLGTLHKDSTIWHEVSQEFYNNLAIKAPNIVVTSEGNNYPYLMCEIDLTKENKLTTKDFVFRVRGSAIVLNADGTFKQEERFIVAPWNYEKEVNIDGSHMTGFWEMQIGIEFPFTLPMSFLNISKNLKYTESDFTNNIIVYAGQILPATVKTITVENIKDYALGTKLYLLFYCPYIIPEGSNEKVLFYIEGIEVMRVNYPYILSKRYEIKHNVKAVKVNSSFYDANNSLEFYVSTSKDFFYNITKAVNSGSYITLPNLGNGLQFLVLCKQPSFTNFLNNISLEIQTTHEFTLGLTKIYEETFIVELLGTQYGTEYFLVEDTAVNFMSPVQTNDTFNLTYTELVKLASSKPVKETIPVIFSDITQTEIIFKETFSFVEEFSTKDRNALRWDVGKFDNFEEGWR